MDSVALEHLQVLGEALVEEGQERRTVALRDLGERGFERRRVLGTVVGRHSHADQQHPRPGAAREIDHRTEVLLHLRHGEAAQAVVRAQLEDHDRRFVLGERLGEARQSSARRLAGDARVDEAVFGPLARQARFEQRHPAAVLRHSVGRRQAVAEDKQGLGERRGSRGEQGEKQQDPHSGDCAPNRCCRRRRCYHRIYREGRYRP